MQIEVTKKRTWFLTTLIGISAIISIAATVTFALMIFIQNGSFLKDDLEQCQKDFSPLPVILISFDGFQGDTFARKITPTLNELKEKGSYAHYMSFSFPPNAAANQYTIVTGLYPEFHGVTSEEMLNETDNWLQGEPIWVTANKRNLFSATYLWPVPKTPDVEQPTHRKEVESPVEQILLWLNSESWERPSWISIYIRLTDSSNDEGVSNEADVMIKQLLEELKKHDLHSCVNILIVANPKVSSINKKDEIIQFKEAIPGAIENKISLSWDTATLILKEDYKNEMKDLETSITCRKKEFQIFRKKELPKRLHYGKASGEFAFLLEEGHTLQVFEPEKQDNVTFGKSTKGLFLAYGPAFKKNFEVDPFQNIELYNFMCHLLGILPAPNNGTWGLLEAMLKIPNRSPDIKGTPPTIQVKDENRWNIFSDNSNCEVNNAATQLLKKANKKKSKIQRQSAPWGVPYVQRGVERANYALLYHADHITGYSTELKQPLWTSFTVQKTATTEPDANPRWIKDVRLNNDDSPSCKNYETITESNTDWTLSPLFRPEYFSESAEMLPFLVSNAAIFSNQLKPHWETLTLTLVQEWLEASQSPLNVVLGPVFDRDADGLLDYISPHDENNIVIPSDYFAIVTKCAIKVKKLEDCPEDKMESMSFIYPQKLTVHLCSMEADEFALLFRAKIRDVERLTGLLFFPNLTSRARLALIAKEYSRLWLFTYPNNEHLA